MPDVKAVLAEEGFIACTPLQFAERMDATPAAVCWTWAEIMRTFVICWTDDLRGPIFAVELESGEQFIKETHVQP